MESLIAGAGAGLAVDLLLYPVDTLKTRLQSPRGFVHAGGFAAIYAGLPAAAVGAAPSGLDFLYSGSVLSGVRFREKNGWRRLVGPPGGGSARRNGRLCHSRACRHYQAAHAGILF